MSAASAHDLNSDEYLFRLHQPSVFVRSEWSSMSIGDLLEETRNVSSINIPSPCRSPLVIGCISPISYTHGMLEMTPRIPTTTTRTPHTQTRGHNPLHPVPDAWIAPPHRNPQPPPVTPHTKIGLTSIGTQPTTPAPPTELALTHATQPRVQYKMKVVDW